jgi:hypothetical protein
MRAFDDLEGSASCFARCCDNHPLRPVSQIGGSPACGDRLTQASEFAGLKSSRQCEAFGRTVEAFCDDTC